MHADTDAIRAYGRTTSNLANELHAAAAALASDLGATLADAFGPVGARFAAALADATTRLANSVTKIGDEVAASGAATTAAAGDYVDVETYSRAQIATVVT
jgi:uncharacterized membrane protein